MLEPVFQVSMAVAPMSNCADNLQEWLLSSPKGRVVLSVDEVSTEQLISAVGVSGLVLIADSLFTGCVGDVLEFFGSKQL